MRIIFLGTNGWYDSPTGNTMCVFIESEKYYVVLDAGSGFFKLDRHIGKDKPWQEVSPKHRDRAAMRYTVKMFLKDLYPVWREIEGLPVRVSYQEEYLGHKHE